jgi:hypothetical protein
MKFYFIQFKNILTGKFYSKDLPYYELDNYWLAFSSWVFIGLMFYTVYYTLWK